MYVRKSVLAARTSPFLPERVTAFIGCLSIRIIVSRQHCSAELPCCSREHRSCKFTDFNILRHPLRQLNFPHQSFLIHVLLPQHASPGTVVLLFLSSSKRYEMQTSCHQAHPLSPACPCHEHRTHIFTHPPTRYHRAAETSALLDVYPAKAPRAWQCRHSCSQGKQCTAIHCKLLP